jgi:hypothetical protein
MCFVNALTSDAVISSVNRGVDDGAGAIEAAVMAFARIDLDDDRALNRA